MTTSVDKSELKDFTFSRGQRKKLRRQRGGEALPVQKKSDPVEIDPDAPYIAKIKRFYPNTDQIREALAAMRDRGQALPSVEAVVMEIQERERAALQRKLLEAQEDDDSGSEPLRNGVDVDAQPVGGEDADVSSGVDEDDDDDSEEMKSIKSAMSDEDLDDPQSDSASDDVAATKGTEWSMDQGIDGLKKLVASVAGPDAEPSALGKFLETSQIDTIVSEFLSAATPPSDEAWSLLKKLFGADADGRRPGRSQTPESWLISNLRRLAPLASASSARVRGESLKQVSVLVSQFRRLRLLSIRANEIRRGKVEQELRDKAGLGAAAAQTAGGDDKAAFLKRQCHVSKTLAETRGGWFMRLREVSRLADPNELRTELVKVDQSLRLMRVGLSQSKNDTANRKLALDAERSRKEEALRNKVELAERALLSVRRDKIRLEAEKEKLVKLLQQVEKKLEDTTKRESSALAEYKSLESHFNSKYAESGTAYLDLESKTAAIKQNMANLEYIEFLVADFRQRISARDGAMSATRLQGTQRDLAAEYLHSTSVYLRKLSELRHNLQQHADFCQEMLADAERKRKQAERFGMAETLPDTSAAVTAQLRRIKLEMGGLIASSRAAIDGVAKRMKPLTPALAPVFSHFLRQVKDGLKDATDETVDISELENIHTKYAMEDKLKQKLGQGRGARGPRSPPAQKRAARGPRSPTATQPATHPAAPAPDATGSGKRKRRGRGRQSAGSPNGPAPAFSPAPAPVVVPVEAKIEAAKPKASSKPIVSSKSKASARPTKADQKSNTPAMEPKRPRFQVFSSPPPAPRPSESASSPTPQDGTEKSTPSSGRRPRGPAVRQTTGKSAKNELFLKAVGASMQMGMAQATGRGGGPRLQRGRGRRRRGRGRGRDAGARGRGGGRGFTGRGRGRGPAATTTIQPAPPAPVLAADAQLAAPAVANGSERRGPRRNRTRSKSPAAGRSPGRKARGPRQKSPARTTVVQSTQLKPRKWKVLQRTAEPLRFEDNVE